MCYICKANPKSMNDILNVSNWNNEHESLFLGISPLHSWIRVFECIIHIANRLDLKKWRILKKNNEENIFLKRKKMNQNMFREKIGLLIYIPKSGGSGTTNAGNTALNNYRIFSEITGIDLKLIKRLSKTNNINFHFWIIS